MSEGISVVAIAYSAGTDAGNCSMRADGRKVWNEKDYYAAVAEYERIDPALAAAKEAIRESNGGGKP